MTTTRGARRSGGARRELHDDPRLEAADDHVARGALQASNGMERYGTVWNGMMITSLEGRFGRVGRALIDSPARRG